MTFVSILGLAALGVVVVQGAASSVPGAVGNHGPTSRDAAELSDQPKKWSLGHGYTRTADHIYFEGARIDQTGRDTLQDFQRSLGRRLVLAHDVHAASFVALTEHYSKDKDKVYYKWVSPGAFWVVVLPDADPATFEVIDFNLSRDANRVWRTDVPIKGVDAATVQVVNPGWVWKDKHSVYYQFTRLAGADPGTFRHLDQAFYRDKKRVYWSNSMLQDADVNTFRTFGNDIPYAVDERDVWFGDARLKGIDAGSFRLLHNHVFADKRGVYVSGRALPVERADVTTFQKLAELEAGGWGFVLFRDAQRAYIFDPYYIEVYSLVRTENSVEITKPVWFGQPKGPVQHAATVSAIWKDGGLTQPVVQMQTGFENTPKPTWEVDKLRRIGEAMDEAMRVLDRKPQAPRADAGGPVRRKAYQRASVVRIARQNDWA